MNRPMATTGDIPTLRMRTRPVRRIDAARAVAAGGVVRRWLAATASTVAPWSGWRGPSPATSTAADAPMGAPVGACHGRRNHPTASTPPSDEALDQALGHRWITVAGDSILPGAVTP